MRSTLKQFRKEMEEELEHILAYWMKYAVDKKNGGFVGRIDHENRIQEDAPRGSVLNSRILWAFSAAFLLTRKPEYALMAKHAYEYLTECFMDKKFGGVYWTVDHRGRPLDTKKQVYALAFALYGLSEYYRCSGDDEAKRSAHDLYRNIIDHSYDRQHGGYIEALSRDWQPMEDLRLSARDANEKKSMNTHLHVLEAFASYYRIFPDNCLKQQLSDLVYCFLDHIISNDTGHLILFFDEAWNPKSHTVSFGHDIESSWLINEASGLVGNQLLSLSVRKSSLRLVQASLEGVDGDGGLWYEYEPGRDHWVRQKHSWPQAEAMVGFFNAWQLTKEDQYLQRSLESWKFVQQFIRDKNCGEWYWGVHEDYSPMKEEDKVGIWKCPYHNSRACIELINRISHYLNDTDAH